MRALAKRLGDRIRVRREELGLSQKDLAARAGFPAHQMVSQIEKGQREVKAWELSELARALSSSVHELLLEERPGPAPHVLWRKAPTEGRHVREAEFLSLCRQYRQLEILAEAETQRTLPTFRVDPEKLQWSNVSRIAQDVSRELSLGVRPAASLVRVLEENYGVKVCYVDLGKEGSAACVVGDFGPAVMMNGVEPPWRRNFNFGHELFHLMTWDSVPPAALQDNRPLSARFEQFANYFASNLLLPGDPTAHEFERRVKGGKISYMDLIEIAREFDVSTEALLWRLVSLRRMERSAAGDLLKDESFRRLDRSSMRGRWWEPPPLPERFVRLAFVAYKKARISRSRLAQYLKASLLDLQSTLLMYGLDESADYRTAVATA